MLMSKSYVLQNFPIVMNELMWCCILNKILAVAGLLVPGSVREIILHIVKLYSSVVIQHQKFDDNFERSKVKVKFYTPV